MEWPPPETRSEEPMDISAIRNVHSFMNSGPGAEGTSEGTSSHGRAISSRPVQQLGGRTQFEEDRWDRLERQVNGLSREFTKLMAITTRREEGARPKSPPCARSGAQR